VLFKENARMLQHELRVERGILTLSPADPLRAGAFAV